MTDRWARLGLVCILAAAPASPHELISTTLTWSDHVARILHRRCASCHREGGSAPMPLVTYEQTRPWAKAIKVQVLSRAMPPWGPLEGYGDFRNDASLAEEEIAVIASWVEGGAPRGDPARAVDPQIAQSLATTEAPAARELAVHDGLRLERRTRVLGVRASGALEIRAKLPNGAILPMLWIPRADPRHPGVYWYREAVTLPAGSILQVFPELNAKASLLIELR